VGEGYVYCPIILFEYGTIHLLLSTEKPRNVSSQHANQLFENCRKSPAAFVGKPQISNWNAKPGRLISGIRRKRRLTNFV
jgi:hypothetical protein